jgi:hypothetical protein
MVTCVLSAALAVGSTIAPEASSAEVKIALKTTPAVNPDNEDRALDAAVRRFRMQIYNTYGSDRAEFERRRAVWEDVQARWRKVGSPAEGKKILLMWLHYAAYQSQANVRGPLPAAPGFQEFNGENQAAEVARGTAGDNAPQPPIPDALQGVVRESDLTPPHVEVPPQRAVERPANISGAEVTAVKPTQRAQPPALPARAAKYTSDEIKIDVGELLARAGGYQTGIQTIDAALVAKQELDASEISALLDELQALAAQRRDLLLYEKLVPPAEQGRLTSALAFPRTTVAELGNRIAAARQRIEAQAESKTEPAESQLQALEVLSRRLAGLSSK